MNFKIAICDDESEEIEKIQKMVTRWAERTKHSVSIETFPSAEAFLFACNGGNLFDILLLDVEMRKINGIDLAKKIRTFDSKAEIIFITSHNEFASEGFEVDALHYLLKPVNEEKFSSVLDRAAVRLLTDPPSIIIQCNGDLIKLFEADILYVESYLHYILIHTIHGEYKIKESISTFAEKLSDLFFRIHRSYLVSLTRVIRISRTSVTLEGNISLPLSRGQYDAVNQAFIRKN